VKPGILVISHGSREKEWVERVEETVAEARRALSGLQPGGRKTQTTFGRNADAAAKGVCDEGACAGQANDERAADGNAAGERADSGSTAVVRAVDGSATGGSSTDERAVGSRSSVEGATDERAAGAIATGEESAIQGAAGEGTAVEVEGAYLELVEGRLIQDGIDRLEAAGVTHLLAIPLFLSTGSTHVDEIGWALGAYPKPRRETELQRMRVRARLTYGRPLANDPEVADALADLAARASANPADESLLVIGHGSDEPWFCEAWERELRGLADRIAERVGFADAAAATLRPDRVAQQAKRLLNRRPESRIVAVPAFVSGGYFTAKVVPERLAGLGCAYVPGSIIPHPRVTDWIVRQALEWLEQLKRTGDAGMENDGAT